MKNRTTIWQIIRLAWLLYRNPHREIMRIGQMILNSMPKRAYYYTENEDIIKALKENNVLHKRSQFR
jgi:hypothetical protein